MVIDKYFIGGYWWLFYSWLLIDILLVAIIFMVIDRYFIGGYWCILVFIIGYYISGY
jgi:hypothetical protein